MPVWNRRHLLKSMLVAPASAYLPASSPCPSAVGGSARFRSVRDYILQAIKEGRATGVSLAVVQRGRLVWAEGFGYADRDLEIPVTPDMPFCLASLTKPFTATLVATLAAQGLLDLDASAMRYLRNTPLRRPNGDPNAITVRMLGAHCSGLPGTFAAYPVGGVVPAPSMNAFLHDYGRLAYPPGTVYEYCNIGFEALGAVVSGVTGQSFETVMDQRLLQPLGMQNSFFLLAARRELTPAIGYDATDKRLPYYTTSTPPSGELYASARDLARFASFHLGRPLPGTQRVLDDRWLRELHAPVFTGPRGIDTTFGWFRGRLATGEPYFFKNGGQPGVAAEVFLIPSADLACVVLSNRTDTMPMVAECCREIISSYVSGFSIPEEDAGAVASRFVPTAEYVGSWKGKLLNAGADQSVLFTLAGDGLATFALSERPAQAAIDLKGQTPGFEGVTSGLVDCTDGAAFGRRTLVLKLIASGGKLVGRVTARGTRPGLLLANIPYVLMLERA